ncbi:methionyl-tRNA formyltransferase [Candidatus Omnitrophota bacterium]
MDIVFFGSSDFSIPSLRALASSGNRLLYLVTQPDRKKGRGLQLGATIAKQAANDLGIKVYQEQDINAGRSLEFLKGLGADLFVVVAFGQILSKELLNIPKKLCVNAHASLLPKYRGAAPVNWAIIKGEAESGVTLIKMSQKMDAGPVIMQEKVNISLDETSLCLEQRLAELSAKLLLKCIDAIKQDDLTFTAQDQAEVSFASKLKKQDGLIDWKSSAHKLHDLVRGSLPWPGAFTYYNGKLLKIYKSSVSLSSSAGNNAGAGMVLEVSVNGITVATSKGALLIKEVQLAGKKRMAAQEFISGSRIAAGDLLGKK